MYLSHLDELQFLVPEKGISPFILFFFLFFNKYKKETKIFFVFPVEARKVFAKQASEVLLKGLTLPVTISTPTHLSTIMETIGQAFDLPLTDGGSEIIQSATLCYRKWLLDESFKPPPLLNDEQYFYKVYITNMFFSHKIPLIYQKKKRNVSATCHCCSGQEEQNWTHTWNFV